MYGEPAGGRSSTTSRSTTSPTRSRPSPRTSTSRASCAASTATPPAPEGDGPKAQVLASGVAVQWALEAQRLLQEDWNVQADVWSVTSWNELRRDGLATDEHNFLHPDGEPRVPYVTTRAGRRRRARSSRCRTSCAPCRTRSRRGCRATSPSLGTDGFGLSDTRGALRRHFQVDAASIVVAVLGRARPARRGQARDDARGDRPLPARRRQRRPDRGDGGRRRVGGVAGRAAPACLRPDARLARGRSLRPGARDDVARDLLVGAEDPGVVGERGHRGHGGAVRARRRRRRRTARARTPPRSSPRAGRSPPGWARARRTESAAEGSADRRSVTSWPPMPCTRSSPPEIDGRWAAAATARGALRTSTPHASAAYAAPSTAEPCPRTTTRRRRPSCPGRSTRTGRRRRSG